MNLFDKFNYFLILSRNIKFYMFGELQMREFDSIVKNTPRNKKRTYYVSSIPLVGINETLNKIIGIISDDTTLNIDDYISSDTYLTERSHIMNKLFELDNVTIIGGDYHYAEYYTFVKNDKMIKQIITSPISSDAITLQSPLYEKIIFWLLTSLFYDRTIGNIAIDKEWTVFDYNYLKITYKNALLCCYDESKSKYIDM